MSFNPYLANTEHVGQLQETLLTCSFAFPFPQKSIPVRFEVLYVGHAGQRQSFTFSSLSGTGITYYLRKNTCQELIMLCDFMITTTQDNSSLTNCLKKTPSAVET
jgi:hypothetical protein